MPTVLKNITDSYVDLALPDSTDIHVQNKGSESFELFFDSSPPGANAQGLTIRPHTDGIAFNMDVGELCYGKADSLDDVAIGVFLL